jgi:CRP-like cAMP-binding protein
MQVPTRITPAMKRDALRGCWLFHNLGDAELDEIARSSPDRRVARRTTIFRRGDPGSSLMLVLAGQVEMSLDDDDGSKRIVYRVVNAGDFFGELAFLDGKPRSADAITTEDTTLIVVERKVFMPILMRSASLVERMFEVLCGRVRATSIAFEEVTLLDASRRLARVLLQMTLEYGKPRPDGSVLIDRRMSDLDLSHLLGALARETVSRTRNSEGWKELILKEKSYFVVTDMAALRRMAEAGARE